MSTVTESQTQTSATGAAIQTTPIVESPTITKSMAKYIDKNPAAPAEQINAFKAQLEANIAASSVRRPVKNSRENRDQRKTAVAAAAAEINAQFCHIRNYGEKLTVLDLPRYAIVAGADLKHGVLKVLDTIRTSLPAGDQLSIVNADLEVLNQGGHTIAYYFKTDEANELSLVYAVASCARNENFDGLYGRELALDRLKRGLTASAPVLHRALITNRFTDEQKLRLVDTYNEYFHLTKQGAEVKRQTMGVTLTPVS